MERNEKKEIKTLTICKLFKRFECMTILFFQDTKNQFQNTIHFENMIFFNHNFQLHSITSRVSIAYDSFHLCFWLSMKCLFLRLRLLHFHEWNSLNATKILKKNPESLIPFIQLMGDYYKRLWSEKLKLILFETYYLNMFKFIKIFSPASRFNCSRNWRIHYKME